MRRLRPGDLGSLLDMIQIAKEWINDAHLSDSEVSQMLDGGDDPQIDNGAGGPDLLQLRPRRAPSRIRQLIEKHSNESEVITWEDDES